MYEDDLLLEFDCSSQFHPDEFSAEAPGGEEEQECSALSDPLSHAAFRDIGCAIVVPALETEAFELKLEARCLVTAGALCVTAGEE